MHAKSGLHGFARATYNETHRQHFGFPLLDVTHSTASYVSASTSSGVPRAGVPGPSGLGPAGRTSFKFKGPSSAFWISLKSSEDWPAFTPLTPTMRSSAFTACEGFSLFHTPTAPSSSTEQTNNEGVVF